VAGDDKTLESAEPVVELLDEAECRRLIGAGGVGRIGYTGRFGPTILPINYALHEGTILFRTGQHSSLGEDLSILIQGAAHLVDSEAERASIVQSGVEPWAGGEKELFVRVLPSRITGRRIRRAGPPAAG
jgi:nitroimidazol reductase NimA-like FMN-containing flavoprotein (pyridoxamine 5'-phosphate oxidase superfamily)